MPHSPVTEGTWPQTRDIRLQTQAAHLMCFLDTILTRHPERGGLGWRWGASMPFFSDTDVCRHLLLLKLKHSERSLEDSLVGPRLA